MLLGCMPCCSPPTPAVWDSCPGCRGAGACCYRSMTIKQHYRQATRASDQQLGAAWVLSRLLHSVGCQVAFAFGGRALYRTHALGEIVFGMAH